MILGIHSLGHKNAPKLNWQRKRQKHILFKVFTPSVLLIYDGTIVRSARLAVRSGFVHRVGDIYVFKIKKMNAAKWLGKNVTDGHLAVW